MLKQWLRHNHNSIYIFSVTKKKKKKKNEATCCNRAGLEPKVSWQVLDDFTQEFSIEYIVWQSPLSTPSVRNVIRMIDWRIYGPKLWQKNTVFEAVEGQGLWNLGITKER